MNSKYVNNCCRLCLEKKSCLQSIFVISNGDDFLPAQAISELFNVQVTSYDSYPKMICGECYGRVKHFYGMRHKTNLNVIPSFLLFKNQTKIVSSTFDYTKKYKIATPDAQHSPVSVSDHQLGSSVDHSPLSLDLDSMVAEEEYNTRKIIVENLLESVACILKEIRKKSNDIGNDSIGSEDLVVQTESSVPEGAEDVVDRLGEGLSNVCGQSGVDSAEGTSDDDLFMPRFRRKVLRIKSSSEDGAMSDDRSNKRIIRPDWGSKEEDKVRCEAVTDAITKRMNCSEANFSVSDNEADRVYTCDYCGKDYKGRWWLSHHIRSTHKSNMGSAKKIGYKRKKVRQRRSRESVWEEMSMEADEDGCGWLRCRTCGLRFTDLDDVRDHVTEEVANPPARDKNSKKRVVRRWFVCCRCRQRYIFPFELLRHVFTQHMDSRPFECDICGNTFKLEKYLKKHMRLHTEPKRIKCEHCDKTFSDNTNLRLHSAVHETESKFRCGDCGKCFRGRHLLLIHLRTHDLSKRIKCPKCPSSFTQRSDLNKHMAKHTGRRDFKCLECGKDFLYRKNLLSHMRIIHP